VDPICKPIFIIECAMTLRELAAFHVMLPTNLDAVFKYSKQNGTRAHLDFRKFSNNL